MKNRRVGVKFLSVFYTEDIGKCVPFREYGFSVHNGVLILWDEDYDPRILKFVDDLSEGIRSELVMAGESKAGLYLYWLYGPPKGYQVGESFEVESDWWNICVSEQVLSKQQEYVEFSKKDYEGSGLNDK